MEASVLDVAIVVAVVSLRLGIPLLIPRYPLPAIITVLVIDGIDQTVFHSWLTPSTWGRMENGYQGYDKALDVYYLTVAYTATMRNWTNSSALRWAQFLWLYRLVGVTLFEILHDSSAPDSWRWLLLVFPNTFEYFFIAYEVVRLRWDPHRLSQRSVTTLVVFIWVVIKLPQEWWIHVARLDFTDFADEHGWVLPTLGVLLVALFGLAWWAIRYRLPGPDWPARIAAGPLPAELDTAAERAAHRAANWRMLDSSLAEKVVLVALICEIFAQILPGSSATPAQVGIAVAVVVVINSAVGLAFARRGRSIENTAAQFSAVVLFNIATVALLASLSSRFELDHALFFVLLISLIVVLYDRYRPIRDVRLAAVADPKPQPSGSDGHGAGGLTGAV